MIMELYVNCNVCKFEHVFVISSSNLMDAPLIIKVLNITLCALAYTLFLLLLMQLVKHTKEYRDINSKTVFF